MRPDLIPQDDRVIDKYKKTVLRAICYSTSCVKRFKNIEFVTAEANVEKENARRGQVECPDCGHALVWLRELPGKKLRKFGHHAEQARTKKRLGPIMAALERMNDESNYTRIESNSG